MPESLLLQQRMTYQILSNYLINLMRVMVVLWFYVIVLMGYKKVYYGLNPV